LRARMAEEVQAMAALYEEPQQRQTEKD